MFFYIFLLINVLKCVPDQSYNNVYKQMLNNFIFNFFSLVDFKRIFENNRIVFEMFFPELKAEKTTFFLEKMNISYAITNDQIAPYDFDFFCFLIYILNKKRFEIMKSFKENMEKILLNCENSVFSRDLYFDVHNERFVLNNEGQYTDFNVFRQTITFKINQNGVIEKSFVFNLFFPNVPKRPDEMVLFSESLLIGAKSLVSSINQSFNYVFRKIFNDLVSFNTDLDLFVILNTNVKFWRNFNYLESLLKKIKKEIGKKTSTLQEDLKNFGDNVIAITCNIEGQELNCLFFKPLFFSSTGNLISETEFFSNNNNNIECLGVTMKICRKDAPNKKIVFTCFFACPEEEVVVPKKEKAAVVSKRQGRQNQLQREQEQMELLGAMLNEEKRAAPAPALAKKTPTPASVPATKKAAPAPKTKGSNLNAKTSPASDATKKAQAPTAKVALALDERKKTASASDETKKDPEPENDRSNLKEDEASENEKNVEMLFDFLSQHSDFVIANSSKYIAKDVHCEKISSLPSNGANDDNNSTDFEQIFRNFEPNDIKIDENACPYLFSAKETDDDNYRDISSKQKSWISSLLSCL